MKRSILVVTMLALLLLAAPAAWAKSTITVNPLGLLIGAISVEYETDLPGFGPQTTLAVPALFWSINAPDLRLSAQGVGAGVKYYTDVAHEGLYFGGYGQFASLSGKVSGTSFKATAFGISGTAGYKWNFASGFVIDANVGIGFPVSVNASVGNIEENQLGGAFGTSVGVGLGFTF